MFCTALYSYFDMIETKDKTKEEIYVQMRVLPPPVLPQSNSYDPDSSCLGSEREGKDSIYQIVPVNQTRHPESNDSSPCLLLEGTAAGKLVKN